MAHICQKCRLLLVRFFGSFFGFLQAVFPKPLIGDIPGKRNYFFIVKFEKPKLKKPFSALNKKIGLEGLYPAGADRFLESFPNLLIQRVSISIPYVFTQQAPNGLDQIAVILNVIVQVYPVIVIDEYIVGQAFQHGPQPVFTFNQLLFGLIFFIDIATDSNTSGEVSFFIIKEFFKTVGPDNGSISFEKARFIIHVLLFASQGILRKALNMG